MNKKASHIGMVISFVIFVGFLFSIYIIITPAIKIERMGNIIDITKNNFIRETNSEITLFSVKIDDENDCVVLVDFFSETELEDEKIKVNNEDYGLGKSGDNLYINNIHGSLIKIYYSEEFDKIVDGTFSDCQNLNKDSGYSFGLTKKEKRPTEEKILELFEKYNNNYEDAKSSLIIPKNNDFEMKFIYPNKTIIYANKSINNGLETNIFLKSFHFEYFSNKNSKEFGVIEIKIW